MGLLEKVHLWGQALRVPCLTPLPNLLSVFWVSASCSGSMLPGLSCHYALSLWNWKPSTLSHKLFLVVAFYDSNEYSYEVQGQVSADLVPAKSLLPDLMTQPSCHFLTRQRQGRKLERPPGSRQGGREG